MSNFKFIMDFTCSCGKKMNFSEPDIYEPSGYLICSDPEHKNTIEVHWTGGVYE